MKLRAFAQILFAVFAIQAISLPAHASTHQAQDYSDSQKQNAALQDGNSSCGLCDQVTGNQQTVISAQSTEPFLIHIEIQTADSIASPFSYSENYFAARAPPLS